MSQSVAHRPLPTEPIALIGVACRFPGAGDPESFWRLMRDGVDAITEVPPDRFDIEALYDPRPGTPGKVASRYGGFLEQVDRFDPHFFGLSPREAPFIDPQHRLVLELGWEALEDAGLAPDKLCGSRTGVFIGMCYNDYQDLMFRRLEGLDLYVTTGGSRFSAAGRLSFCLGLQGPSLMVDTACSSSVVAVHLACQSLRSRECTLALAGGVNLILQPQVNICLSQGNVIAPDGRCKFGDARADGYVRSEGAGLVVLKRLADALADNDPIYAVIRASAVNHKGSSDGALVTPSGPSLEAVMREAYRSAGLLPGQVQYVEAHGTGTSTGDVVEIPALGAVMAEGRPAGRPCLIGSVKTNIGHSESASGAASLIKLALCLKHRVIPPSLHLREPNPNIPWANLPLLIQRELSAWPADSGPAIAGLNSFGIAGTNAHVVLEEAPARAPMGAATERHEHLLTLSAQSEPALRELAGRYACYLKDHPGTALGDVCFTAYTGRSHFAHRLALVAVSNEEARHRLASFAARGEATGVVHGCCLTEGGRQMAAWSAGQTAGQTLLSLGQRYVEGAQIDWPSLEADGSRRRLSLPTYPFQRQRYWIDTPEHPTPGGRGEASVDQCLYQVRWERRPIASERPAARSTELARVAGDMEPRLAELARECDLAVYDELIGQLDALSVSYVLEALGKLGLRLSAGESFSVDVLADRLQVSAAHRRLFGQLLKMLTEAGWLRAAGGQWQVCREPAISDARLQWTRLMSRYPVCQAELEVLGRCGTRLAEVLRGDCDPLGLLFPDGSLGSLERLYEQAPFARAYNRLIAETLARAMADFPADRPLRILEIGAGTGSTTSCLLDHLPAERVAYVFTDVSPLFLAHARRKFSTRPFMQYELLDIERDPDGQGFQGRRFDVVIAANVLHATADLRRTLGHVRRLIAPHGLLMLLEVTSPQHWADLIFGLTEGWWKFADRDLRPDYPLLSRDRWLSLLAQAGWREPVSIGQTGGRFEQSLLLARAPGQAGQASQDHQGDQADQTGRTRTAWLILADRGGVGSALAGQVRARGGQCTLVYADRQYGRLPAGDWLVDPREPEHFRRLLADLGQAAPERVTHILHLWSLDSPAAAEELTVANLESAQLLGCGSGLHLVQALVAQSVAWSSSRLWLVTRGAQPVRAETPGGAVSAVAQAPLWGFGRVAALEHPQLWGGLVDLDPADDADRQAAGLLAQIEAADGEDQVGLRDGERYVARLVRVSDGRRSGQRMALGGEGTYLVTGGLGGLGLHVARWLVERGARHLVLMGRSAPSEAARQVLRELEDNGACVSVLQGDVAREQDVARVLATIKEGMPPLCGVVHAAGVTTFEPLAGLTYEALANVLRPKVAGAWNLHCLTREAKLDFFVVFSSAASVWGSQHMAHYAAANQFLDTLVHYRRGLGLTGLSINWGRLSERGMLSAEMDIALARIGLQALPIERALEAMGRLIQNGCVQATVAQIDWTTFKPIYEARSRRPLLEHFETAPARQDERASETSATLADRLKGASPAQGKDILIDHLRNEVAAVLGLDAPHRLDVHRGFFDLGMDSLTAIELKNRLQRGLQRDLPSALLFEYSCIARLADYLAGEVATVGERLPESDQRRRGPADVGPSAEMEQDMEQSSLREVESALADELAAIEELLGGA